MTKKGKMAGPRKNDEKKEEGEERKSSENLMVSGQGSAWHRPVGAQFGFMLL